MIRMLFGLVLLSAASAPAFASELGDDGLYKPGWFSVTFRDLSEDLETANESGKRLVMFFEQRGCVYCKQVHETVLTDPEVRDFIEKNYMVVQYNLYGDEDVVDFDGDDLTEKSAARKWGVLFTPTILFMPEEADSSKSAKDQAVAVMPGAFRKGTFLDMFRWVHQRGYEGDEDFQRYHARSIRERAAAGLENTD
ncbi:MAG: thioredoxin family protein [Pseudomonadota bacterium]